ncbi:MAG: UDP-N-acetylmuramyl-tripeptide synthetase, partial [Oscillospiraceae bacterium]
FNAKKELFKIAKFAVINIDDEFGKKIIESINIPYFSYSTKDESADFFADEIKIKQDGVSFLMKYSDINVRMDFPIAGIYSVLNVLATTATAIHLGISIETIKKTLEKFTGISGRCEKIQADLPFNVFCDYAHTPDGLLNILKSVKQFTKGRLILLFGAGGDRDEKKRALMGKVASENADFLVVTSDNPRTESQEKIIGQIIKGIDKKTEFIAIKSRTDAIKYALSIAKKGDTVLLAGKGHELYNVFGDKKIYYDERKIVLAYSKKIEIEI